jgi:oligoendopeptidase F
VPSSAFTEALAFLFQAHDLELLGRPRSGERAERDRVLDAFWSAREIAGAALIELDAWRWLYQNPTATPAQLGAAIDRIARAVWKRYFAPSLGGDTPLLAIYSHTIYLPLYLFHYMLGHLIAFQVDRHLSGQDRAGFAREFERVSRIGAVTPDVWMKLATGAPVSTRPLLDATAAALGGGN